MQRYRKKQKKNKKKSLRLFKLCWYFQYEWVTVVRQQSCARCKRSTASDTSALQQVCIERKIPIISCLKLGFINNKPNKWMNIIPSIRKSIKTTETHAPLPAWKNCLGLWPKWRVTLHLGGCHKAVICAVLHHHGNLRANEYCGWQGAPFMAPLHPSDSLTHKHTRLSLLQNLIAKHH